MSFYDPTCIGGGIGSNPGEKPISVKKVEEQKMGRTTEEELKHIAQVRDMIAFPDKTIENFRNAYKETVVHDYGDEYHWSDEKRNKQIACYDLFKEYRKGYRERPYKDVVRYIEKCRQYYNIVNEICKNNGVYEPDEFMKLFKKGKIEIFGLRPPKLYKRIIKTKGINMSELVDFIAGNEKASQYSTRTNGEDNVFDPLDNSSVDDFLSKSLKGDIIASTRIGNNVDEEMAYHDDLPNSAPFAEPIDIKDWIKTFPDMKRSLIEMRRSIEGRSYLGESYLSTGSELDKLDRYDVRAKDKGKPPKFKGSIMDYDNYNEYVNDLLDWQEDHIYVNVNGSSVTLAEEAAIDARDMLAEGGYNIKKLPSSKELIAKTEKEKQANNDRFIMLRNKLINSGTNSSMKKYSTRKKNKFAKGKQNLKSIETPDIVKGKLDTMKMYEKCVKKSIKRRDTMRQVQGSDDVSLTDFMRNMGETD